MENKFLYRSSLKSKDIPVYQMMGIVSELVLSKTVFKKNNDISDFIKKIFGIEFKDYVMKSRTMILARTVRLISTSSDIEYQVYRKKLLNFIEEYYDNSSENRSSSNRTSVSEWVTRE